MSVAMECVVRPSGMVVAVYPLISLQIFDEIHTFESCEKGIHGAASPKAKRFSTSDRPLQVRLESHRQGAFCSSEKPRSHVAQWIRAASG